ncbi:MAG: gliding motility-associated C-terminal domain-containing protein [Chitinophagales bacterium]
MNRIFIAFVSLFFSLSAMTQTLQLTSLSQDAFCATGNDSIAFSLDYTNIPSNSNIVFYQSKNPNFNPYLGEGDSIGFINIGSNTTSTGQITSTCAEIVGIFIDACDQGGVLREVDNEYIILTSGATGFDVRDLQIKLPNNNINTSSTTCEFLTPSAANMTTLRNGTCNPSNLFAAGQNDVIPPNAIVIVFTGRGTIFNYNFSSYCSSGQPIYILQNSCSPSTANYANNAPGNCPNKYRTTTISVGSCQDELTYDPCSLPNYDASNPNANDGNYAIHLPNTDTSSTYNGGIRNNGVNLCNGIEFDSIAGTHTIKVKIPNDGTGNGGTATNFCNDGYHYIKAITNPKSSQPISNAIQYKLICLDVNTSVSALNICSGNNANVQISSSDPNASFSWTVSGGSSITGASAGIGNTINQTLNYNGNTKDSLVYTITAKDGNCTKSKTVKVVVNKCSCTINFDFGIDNTTVCNGSSVTIDASTAYDQYIWNTNASSHSITVTQPGKYWVDVFKNGCKGTDTIMVVSGNKPIKPSIGRDTSFCGNFSLPLSVPTYPTNTTIEWFRNNTVVGNTNNYTATQSGNYMVKVTNLCGSVYDTLVITSSGGLNVYLGKDTTLCSGKTLLLNATVSGSNITYNWNTGAQTPTISVSQFGRYDVVVSNGACTVYDTILVDFMDKPTINSLGNDTLICGSFSMQLFTGDANTKWNTNVVGPQITVTSGGLYIAENSNQCGSVKDSILITQHTKPTVNIGADATFCDSMQLTVGNGNFSSILWNTGDTIPSITVLNSGLYSVKVSNSNCSTIDSVQLTKACLYEVEMPTAFSPNGDGLNDFIAPLSYRNGIEILDFTIFNRWGEVVFAMNNFIPNSMTNGWDGFFKGTPAQVDDYVYVFKAKMPDNTIKSYKGIFSLLR